MALRAESEDQHLNASVYVGHDSSSLSDVCVTYVCHSCVSHTHVCASISLIRIRGNVCVLEGLMMCMCVHVCACVCVYQPYPHKGDACVCVCVCVAHSCVCVCHPYPHKWWCMCVWGG